MTTKEMLLEMVDRLSLREPTIYPDWMTKSGESRMQVISARKAKLLMKISEDVSRLRAERGGLLVRAYDYIDARCHIAAVTMKKVLTERQPITREFLYKYTVGLGMTLDQAQEYFELQGGRLRDDSDEAELIVFNALKDRDDIDSLASQFQNLLGLKLFRTEKDI